MTHASEEVTARRERPDVSIRCYEPADESAVLALLQASLAGGPTGRRTAAFFRWKHERNPFGRSFALVAEADGQIVGFRTFMRWQLTAAEQTIRAVRAVDTATHPAYQGQGIFTSLTRAAIEGVRDHVQLIFNTPNAQSLPGYRKMGWADVGRMPIALRVVRPLRFAARVRHVERGAQSDGDAPPPGPLAPVRAVIADEDAVGELLAEAAGPDGRLATERSVAYLRWRYAEAPDIDYRALTIHAGGRLVALAIARPRRRGPLAELTLAEAFVRPGDRTTARRLLKAIARAAGDHVTAHFAPDTVVHAVGARAGYWAVPGRGMTLVARRLADVQPDPLVAASWRLSLGDLEVF